MKILLLLGPCVTMAGACMENQRLQDLGFAVSLIAFGITIGRIWMAASIMMLP